MSVDPATRPGVAVHGAPQAVTGSMHELAFAGRRYLLDCGIVLGRGSDAHARNRHFPFPPAEIHAVLLTHAHVDHCGNLPNLVRQGFNGPIYCTPATRDLLEITLHDSARFNEQDARVDNLLGREEEAAQRPVRRDVDATLDLCRALPYDTPAEIGPGVRARFTDAGHLLGSAVATLTCERGGETRTVTYTGDLGRPDLRFLRAPAPLPLSDLLISESTYGGREHQPIGELARRLKEAVSRTVERGGKILIPAFSLGRAQLVVHYLRQWMEEGLLPVVPIAVDSRLAADIAEVYRHYPTLLVPEARPHLAADGPVPVEYVRDRDESRALSHRPGPSVLVASGGMCEGGRIVGHLEHNLDDPRNTVLLVSYQAPGSLGRKLLERGPTVKFRNKKWNKWADIVDLNGFSGHAGRADFLNFFRPLRDRNPRVRLVHGDPEQAAALAQTLRAEGFDEVEVPRRVARVLGAGGGGPAVRGRAPFSPGA